MAGTTQSNTIQLTFIEAENNESTCSDIHCTRSRKKINQFLASHQMTEFCNLQICPLHDEQLDASDPNTTLRDVMFKTPYYPPALFLSIANSPKLKAKQHSSWLKGKDGRDQDLLVQCMTFDIDQDITLGSFESKANFLLLKREPTRWALSPAPSIKEYWVYVHNMQGYLNSFMLGNGRPAMIIPAFDRKHNGSSALEAIHYMIKPSLKRDTVDCNPNLNQTVDCLESYLMEKHFGHCRIPWKMLRDERPPCPPCQWKSVEKNQTFCVPLDGMPDDNIHPIYQCHKELGNESCAYYGRRINGGDECMLCEVDCQPYRLEELCTSRNDLTSIIKHWPYPWESNKILRESGCSKPCQYMKYDVRHVSTTSTNLEFDSQSDKASLLTLELSTESIQTIEQAPAYSLQTFFGDIGGNIGILFGFSIMKLQQQPYQHSVRRDGRRRSTRKIVIEIVLVATAISWTIVSFLRFNGNRIRQEQITVVNEGNTGLPAISFCPVYEDRLLLPVTGFVKHRFSLEKYQMVHGRNFLSMKYPLKGSWEPKWKYYQDNIFQATVHGHQCFTYQSDVRQARNNQFTVELKTGRIELILGYIHEANTLQHAFLHKSSVPQIYIPNNSSKLSHSALPNQYTFHVKTHVIKDFDQHQECNSTSFTESDLKYCYIHQLEASLGCNLNWDQSNELSVCQQCQFPFQFNGKVYNRCILNEETNKSWCPTALKKDRSQFSPLSWQYCPNGCQNLVLLSNNANVSLSRSCETRTDLERLVSNMFDRQQTNPKNIAKALKDMGCPFSCQYSQYSVESVLKRHDPRIETDVVQLNFELIDVVDGGQSVLAYDVDITLDMFMSDIGTAFGLLLGLSLMDMMSFLAASAMFCLQTLTAKNYSPGMRIHSILLFLYWLVIAIVIGALIIAGVSKRFTDFLSINLAPSAETNNHSTLLDTSDSSKLWLQSLTKDELKLKTCPYREDVGDSYCDEQANTEMCLYDGGDCCSLQKEFRPNVHLFCQDCSCLTPNSSFEEHHERKPGVCEYCVFPFKDNWGKYQSDCYGECSQFGCSFSCPVALNKDTLKPTGAPYQWTCPQSADELYPTCIVDKFTMLLEKHVHGVWNCAQQIPTKNATASSVERLYPIVDGIVYFEHGVVTHSASYAIDGMISAIGGYFYVSDKEKTPWLEIGKSTKQWH